MHLRVSLCHNQGDMLSPVMCLHRLLVSDCLVGQIASKRYNFISDPITCASACNNSEVYCNVTAVTYIAVSLNASSTSMESFHVCRCEVRAKCIHTQIHYANQVDICIIKFM